MMTAGARRLVACILAVAVIAAMVRPAPISADECVPSAGFEADSPVVLTYYYYWYDQSSLDDPALTMRPPPGQPFDWRDAAWHERQLADMAAAGIDVALPVYWGTVPEWSIGGLGPIVEARERLIALGQRAPLLAPFFDTNLYAEVLKDRPELADLTSPDALEFMIDELDAFFRLVPACHRARMGDRPIIVLWRSDTEDGGVFNIDGDTASSLYARLEERLGARPYIVRERTWDELAAKLGVRFETDDAYVWGAALGTTRLYGRTAAVGPGYDDRGIAGRIGYERLREEGAAFSRDLESGITAGAPWLLLETWNELWEATGIADSENYGRAFIDVTHRHVELFHELIKDRALDARVDLATGRGSNVERLAHAAEEQGTPDEREGRVGARPHIESEEGVGYFHLALRPRFLLPSGAPLVVQVEYFDEGSGSFYLEYDDGESAFAATPEVPVGDSRTWMVHRFELTGARLSKRQYDGFGDLRIKDQPPEDGSTHLFGRVVVSAGTVDRPALLGPGELSTVGPGDAVDVRWLGTSTAQRYLLHLRPAERDLWKPSPNIDDRWLACPHPPAAPNNPRNAALALERACAVTMDPGWRGLVRWQVIAIDAKGTASEPSDWGYILVQPRRLDQRTFDVDVLGDGP